MVGGGIQEGQAEAEGDGRMIAWLSLIKALGSDNVQGPGSGGGL